MNSKFQQQEVLVYRGAWHRLELNKWVTEICPIAHKRKIWLGTYKSPEEATRAYNVGIHYTGKKSLSTSLSLSRISQNSHKDLAGKSCSICEETSFHCYETSPS